MIDATTEFNNNTYTSKSFLRPRRMYSTAVEMNNKGYLIGGEMGDGNDEINNVYSVAFSDTDEYTPDLWVSKTPIPGTGHSKITGININNNIYIFGGYNNDRITLATNYKYGSTDIWVAKTDTPVVTSDQSGGNIYGSGYLAKTSNRDFFKYRYDTWITKAITPAIINRTGSFSINTRVYVCGGDNGSLVNDTNEYQNDYWSAKAELNTSVGGHACASKNDITVYTTVTEASPAQLPTYITDDSTGIGNGYTFWGHDVEEYDYASDTWNAQNNIIWPPRRNGGTSLIDSKGFLYYGQTFEGPDYTASDLVNYCDEYNPDTFISRADGPAPVRRYIAAATVSNKGYVFGGNSNAAQSTVALDDTDEFYPDTWTSKADSPQSMWGITAEGLNGKGYVWGWYNTPSLTRDTFEYTVGTNSWTTKADYPLPHKYRPSSFALNNRGYLCKGTDCEQYTTGTDSWLSMSDLLASIDNNDPTMVVNDKGHVLNGSTHQSYDYVINTWTYKEDPTETANATMAIGI